MLKIIFECNRKVFKIRILCIQKNSWYFYSLIIVSSISIISISVFLVRVNL